MSTQELFALCTALMCDDDPVTPSMGMANRNILVDLANREARVAHEDWISFYLGYTQ